MTTTQDPAASRCPADKWYSDQIPADYPFGFTPVEPRLSVCSHRPAHGGPQTCAHTVALESPRSATETRSVITSERCLASSRGSPRGSLRWGILEWNPVVLAVDDTTSSRADPAPYRVDTNLLVQHRPGVVSPFTWDNPTTR